MTNRSVDQSILRIIDAAKNRAGEGLRVVEDFCRMHLEDTVLTRTAKGLRHALTASLSSLEGNKLLAARDTSNDIGTAIRTDSEYQRAGHDDVLRSNFSRIQQSLRTIEEYGKMFDPNMAIGIEQIRYETYTLEKAIANSQSVNVDLAGARLYVLTDLRGSLSVFESLIRELISAEVDLIQLRDKAATDRQLIVAGLLLTKLTRETATRWIMNDRADLAVIANADGVHVGQNDLPVKNVRDIIGPEKIVGVSTHNIEQARAVISECPSYIAIGPVFESATKAFDSFATMEFIRQSIAEISLPLFAIGGIDEGNVAGLIEIGVQRVAVSNCVVAADSPTKAVADLKSIISRERTAKSFT